MSEYVSVDSFLQELTREGHLDSAGEFTLSLDHAKDKLSEFLLNSTDDYLLKLIQAGVAAGANRMELNSGTSSVHFVMHGVSFAPHDLENILAHLLRPAQGAQARALRHLAIAINTAIMTRATGITLATWDGRHGHRIFWKSTGRSSQNWRPSGSQPQVLFQLRRTVVESASQFMHLLSQRDILSMLLGSRAGLDPDRQMVLDRAIWCPVPLALNGRWMPRPAVAPPAASGVGFARQRIEQRLWLERSQPDDPGIRNFNEKGLSWPWRRNYLAPQSGTVSAGTHGVFDGTNSQLNWVLDGVLVASQPLHEIPMGSFGWGVMSAHGCSTDLTGMRPVQNEFLQSLAEPAFEALKRHLGVHQAPVNRLAESPGATLPGPDGVAQVDRVAAWEAVRRRRKRFKS
jgi:hypothetical protein